MRSERVRRTWVRMKVSVVERKFSLSLDRNGGESDNGGRRPWVVGKCVCMVG